MAVLGKSRTFAPSKHRKFQKLKDNKPSRRAARQHTWRAFFILGGSGIIVHYRLFSYLFCSRCFRLSSLAMRSSSSLTICFTSSLMRL